nr:telomere length regulation protein TEL2 homolog [Anolis sagrei ordinatus]
MEGMKCHLDSNSPRIRLMGMVVAECLSEKITPEGPALKFQYEEDDEIKELKSLVTEKPDETTVSDTPSIKNGISAAGPREVPKPSMKEVPAASKEVAQGTDSELDSDDELLPYDMSHDKELKKTKAPTYLRDCLEILTGPEDADKYEAAMTVLETLIRKNAAAVQEMGVELAKVLLHLEEKSYIEGFVGLRQSAMAAIVVIHPIPVAQYLTSEFYSLNYSLRQRMDILDVLTMAAQELSQPVSPDSKQPPPSDGSQIQFSGSSSSDWQKVVDERIKNKTRRFAKGRSQAEPRCAPNRFGPVAGHFFFPLLQNFDRPLSTFDLLGDDHLVLGRLAHTLAILMYFAVNTVVAAAMGKALLEFIWVLRFHTDTYVRQGLLSCVSSLVLSLPPEHLLEDMAEELLEIRFWLADVAEKDPDGESRRLAVQNLLLVENLKKRLESSPP